MTQHIQNDVSKFPVAFHEWFFDWFQVRAFIRLTFHGICRSISRTRIFRSTTIARTVYLAISIWLLHRPQAIRGDSVVVTSGTFYMSLSLTESNDKPWRIHCATREQAFMLKQARSFGARPRSKFAFLPPSSFREWANCRSRTMIVSTKLHSFLCSVAVGLHWNTEYKSQRPIKNSTILQFVSPKNMHQQYVKKIGHT